ncbi:CRISPR-associated endonuclease Cas2 [Gordonia sp. (in: high G+C Gram-positive bacteria)]|uniref:CRISPR-associated endonuclease Cas2 n=1 Tax=Gordonia sp. (in: high G+C Gram-positive bacteria) TaxID=84139 RepID=UPI003C756290
MTPSRSRLLIAYDIVDDPRRVRLSKVLESYGDRVQYSVFLIDLTAAQQIRLRKKVSDVIDPRVDSVLFCVVGPVGGTEKDRLTYLGCRRRITDGTSFIL